MDTSWKEFRKQPGLYFRFTTDGRIELLGKPECVDPQKWQAIAEELAQQRRIEELRQSLSAGQQPVLNQMELFSNAGLKDLQSRLESIPVLRPDKKSA